MPTDLVMLLVTAVLAVTALAAAVVAVRAARRSGHTEHAETGPALPAVAPEPRAREAVLVPIADQPGQSDQSDLPGQLAPRHVEGRVVVPPTGEQVVGAALSRPHVRLAIVLHGLSYALRAESRDRISALMRREYRRRRRERLTAGRRAVRAAHPAPSDRWTAQPWMGELTTGASSSTKAKS